MNGSKREPELIDMSSPRGAKIKNLSSFFPNVSAVTDNDDNIAAEEAPLDLSQSNPAEEDIADRRASIDDGESGKKDKPLQITPPMFPPGLPYFIPGLAGQNPFALFYPHLMMPQLLGQNLDKETQEKLQKDLLQRLQLQSAAGRPPFPPAVPTSMPTMPLAPLDIAGMMAAQAESLKQVNTGF